MVPCQRDRRSAPKAPGQVDQGDQRDQSEGDRGDGGMGLDQSFPEKSAHGEGQSAVVDGVVSNAP